MVGVYVAPGRANHDWEVAYVDSIFLDVAKVTIRCRGLYVIPVNPEVHIHGREVG